MRIFEEDYFLFVPDPHEINRGTAYSLRPGAAEDAETVVLIPYSNPAKKKPTPLYFKIQKQKVVILPNASEKVPPDVQLRSGLSREDYLERIKKLKKHIQRGDIYEINYCLEFSAENVQMDPISVFLRLREISMAPYGMLLRLKEEYILCASPELFLKKTLNHLQTKPIKGTARRSQDANEDERIKEQLRTSEKERSENIMAVDVARNDLSILAKRGTVQVPSLCTIESFKTVHQLVTTVTCELKPDLTFEEILTATFPMASMTGAPKKRAMDLIDDTETFKRHYYSGALGIKQQDDFELAVLIRSIFYNSTSKHLRIAVGGAITHLCDPEQEYEECLLKAEALMKALGASLGGTK